ncbi:50S ribosome-binding protein YggL [Crenobacter sp. SG2303]|uniref:50S ribosome-binding protein YggL n=1 Tax=Crenobacter oryzisoli TaxID=3056844 RepID=A0ABT7XQD8_9NEIS|nr:MULTISPECIES: 50S ribosome-binding protein YggL [unclassified Crenobacter]MDN0075935.1 50S ribosome-binding protein YggL [Crenobacter sp. SG2303]MDN0085123.1 50S ribosome-binding protein YggL [Crenobacter sp. SG2305]
MSTLRNPNSRRRLSRLSERQKKKLRVGEYQELGFRLEATLNEGVDVTSEDILLDEWLVEVERHDVSFGGHFAAGKPSTLNGMVFPVGRGGVDAGTRDQLVAWLKGRPEVAQLEAGELIDVWYN